MNQTYRTARAALLGAGMVGMGFILASVARGDTVVLSAVADTTLYAEDGSQSNGVGNSFFAGSTALSEIRRALIRFDTSAIPTNATVTSVTLTLYCSRTRSPEHAVSLHRLSASWGEGTSHAPGGEGSGTAATLGDATWTHRVWDNRPWSTPGGSFVALPSATTTVGNQDLFYTWSSAGMTADVQAWVNSPFANFGWILIGDESTNQTAKRFESRQSTVPSQRPTLTINYTTGSTSGACCLASGSCTIATAAVCASQSGTYQGDNTTCTPNPCPPPVGACCFADTSCAEVSAGECLSQNGAYQGDATTCAAVSCPLVLEPFVDALPIAAVAQPQSGVPGGAAHYVIAMTEFTQALHRDLPPTQVWGYGGTYPGPTIEARRNQPVTVEWVNDLRDPQGALRTTHYLPVDTCLHGPNMTGEVPVTVVHLHGGHVPADSDGHPEASFAPGQQSAIYDYPNIQPAATLWYHDHALGITRLNVYMGLAGFYLLRDAAEDALDIPRGEFEIPLAIQDRSFNADGSLMYHDMWHEHFFGDFILVNGKVWPYLSVKQAKYRFRMLNGSNSRVYTLALSDGATFWQIGTDTGLLPAPVPLTSLTIAPGERADVVMDFAVYAPGTEVVLVNSAPAPFPGPAGSGVVPDVMKFIVTDQAGDTDPLPASLVPLNILYYGPNTLSRDFELRMMFDATCGHDMWTINERMWDEVTETPRLGRTEIWRWINRSGITHPMHLHLVSFQVMDRQDFTVVGEDIVPVGPQVPPPPNERGWKDTVQATPNQITRVITRFEDFAGLFAYHCHILEHEDHEMMRQFHAAPPGDADLDGDVDLTDYAAFTDCLAGPGVAPSPPPPATAAECLDAFDFDRDQDVDLVDFDGMQTVLPW